MHFRLVFGHDDGAFLPHDMVTVTIVPRRVIVMMISVIVMIPASCQAGANDAEQR